VSIVLTYQGWRQSGKKRLLIVERGVQKRGERKTLSTGSLFLGGGGRRKPTSLGARGGGGGWGISEEKSLRQNKQRIN